MSERTIDIGHLGELPDSSASVVRRRFRLGAAALVLGGVLYVIAAFLVADVITPPSEARVVTVASAVNANSMEWRVGMALSFVADAAVVLGWFALYAHLARTRAERWALAGLVVTVVFGALYAPLLGVVTYALPAAGALVESGGTDAMAVIDRTWTDPFIFLPFVSAILSYVGVVLMGVAVWRSGTLSKIGGIGLVFGGVLGIPAFLDVVELSLVAPVVYTIGLVLVGAALWRSGGQEKWSRD